MASASIENGSTISYYVQGPSTGPAVVLLAGPTDAWGSYAPVLGCLPEDLRAVAVSLRGHGESSKPPSGYGIEDLASDVGPLLDELDVGRAVLGGHSGSCLVARRVALDRPGRVAGLFLEAAPTTLRGHERLTEFVASVVSELVDPIDPEFARSFVTDTSVAGLDPDLVERLVEDVLRVPATVWREMFESLLHYDDTAELHGLLVPTMLIWGDRDELVPSAMQEQLLHLVPRSERTVYPNAGHTPRWEQPERFAADLATFARRVLA